MDASELLSFLEEQNANPDFIQSLTKKPVGVEEFWRTSKRPDFMLWLAMKLGVDHSRLVLAAVAVARLAPNAGFVIHGRDKDGKEIVTFSMSEALNEAEKAARGEKSDIAAKASQAVTYAHMCQSAHYALLAASYFQKRPKLFCVIAAGNNAVFYGPGNSQKYADAVRQLIPVDALSLPVAA